jgi:hypothetical protein
MSNSPFLQSICEHMQVQRYSQITATKEAKKVAKKVAKTRGKSLLFLIRISLSNSI